VLADSLERIRFGEMNLSGLTIGITAGSRGISEMPRVLGLLCETVRSSGGLPVIIPAMGTHGGDSAQRQLDVLADLGITESAVGAPIWAGIETRVIGRTEDGLPVHCQQTALTADGLIVVNRIKPHTDFSGEIESGLCKMMAIGLGGHAGAEAVHSFGFRIGLERAIVSTAGLMLKKLPVLFGLGILENWMGQLSALEAALPDELIDREKEVLAKVKRETIKLPFDQLDVLVIGRIGKNISGTGMDTKVVGRLGVKGQPDPEKPDIGRIVVLRLTPESHGNATGIGLADVTTKAVFEATDLFVTSDNCLSSMAPEQGRLPCLVENDRSAFESGLVTLGRLSAEEARLVYITDTLNLGKMLVSEALLPELESVPGLEVLAPPADIVFDDEGNLKDFEVWPQ